MLPSPSWSDKNCNGIALMPHSSTQPSFFGSSALLLPPTHPGCCIDSFCCPHFPAWPQVYDVLNADRIVVEKAALAYINEWFSAGEQ